MSLIGYFGFGSLVNKDTLRTSYVSIAPAVLKGWRRHWQARTETLPQKVALLSVHRDTRCEIKGALVVDKSENLAAVDQREAGYTRVQLSADDLVVPTGYALPERLYVYVADEVYGIEDDGALLQSYMDAVMQGFYREHGEEGVKHFVDTTEKFARPVIQDRNNPLYPRSVSLSEDEAMLFDTELIRAGAKFLPQ